MSSSRLDRQTDRQTQTHEESGNRFSCGLTSLSKENEMMLKLRA